MNLLHGASTQGRGAFGFLRHHAGRASGTLVASLFAGGIAFVTAVVLARGLGPEGRGALAALMVVATLVIRFALLGTDEALVRVAAQPRYTQSSLLRFSVRFALAIGGLAAALFVVYEVLADSEDLVAALIVAIAIPASIYHVLLRSHLLGVGAVSWWNLTIWLQPALYFATLVAFTLTSSLELRTAVASFLGSSVVAAGITLVWVRRAATMRTRAAHGQDAAEREDVDPRAIVSFGSKLVGGRIASEVGGRLDLLALSWFASLDQLGVYAVASGLAIAPGGVLQAQANLSYSRMSRSGPDDFRAVCRREGRRLAALYLSIAVVGALAIGLVVDVVFGDDFADATAPARILFLGVAPFGLTMYQSAKAKAVGVPGVITIAEVIALAAAAPLIVYAASQESLEGTAAAVAFGYCVGAVGISLLMRRERDRLPESAPSS